MLKTINELLGIQDDLRAEQNRFVERIAQTVFKRIEALNYPIKYESVFRRLCYWLGTNPDERISRANQHNFARPTIIPALRSLTDGDFTSTLKVLMLVHQVLDDDGEEQEALSTWIETALQNTTIDIGFRWKHGLFYRSGAKELDEALIEQACEWLNEFPQERTEYLNALRHYTEKRYDDVISNCYLVVEGITRALLGNTQTLDNNREEIIRKTGWSQEWKGLLNNYIVYANEFKRHASEKRHALNPIEVEGFLYMTGLLVRILTQSLSTTPFEGK